MSRANKGGRQGGQIRIVILLKGDLREQRYCHEAEKGTIPLFPHDLRLLGRSYELGRLLAMVNSQQEKLNQESCRIYHPLGESRQPVLSS